MEIVLNSQIDDLQEQLKNQRNMLSEELATRLHRAISWLASAQNLQEDRDMAFVSLWIGLSACYYTHNEEPQDSKSEFFSEKKRFKTFAKKLHEHDAQQKLYELIWEQFSGPVKALIKNPYVYAPFWESQRNQDRLWEDKFNFSSVEALNFLSRKNVPDLLGIVLDRLYVLRNQVLQGGATYNSRVNREQLHDATDLLSHLVPLIIKIMMDTPKEDWDPIAYPVIVDLKHT